MQTIEFDDYALHEETCKRIVEKLTGCSHLEFIVGYKRSGISCMLFVTTKHKITKKNLRDIFFMTLLEFVAKEEN